MSSRRFYLAPQLKAEFCVNPAPRLEPIRQVVLDCFCCDVRQSELPEHGPQKLQRVQILLVVARAPERRLRAPFEEPVGPLVECELFAVQNSRESALVSRVQAVPKEALGLLTIGRACRL